jgi:hypothetical protein
MQLPLAESRSVLALGLHGSKEIVEEAPKSCLQVYHSKGSCAASARVDPLRLCMGVHVIHEVLDLG